jgi:phosphoribosylformimino-5-aminoimidazole carboxamide ribotide isomerase
MHIVPSIDIVEGQCVRLLKGEYEKKTTYSLSPKEMAQQFIHSGASSLHVVDLDGAKDGRVINWDALQEILMLRGVEIQVGGGIRTESEIERLLELGATRVVVGSAAVTTPELVQGWAKRFGSTKFCIALDLDGGRLAYQGWLKKTNRTLADTVVEMTNYGITRFLSTDIRKDGTLEGPNVELYTSLVQTYPQVSWFASGGVRSIEDVRALKAIGLSGVIIGKALFEGALRLEDLLEASC